MLLTKEDLFSNYLSIDENRSATSSKGKIDRNGHYYHVTSHSFNEDQIYSFEVSLRRQNLLFKACRDNGVLVLFSTIQPTHTHDVFFAQSITDIMKVMQIVNTKVAHFVKVKNPKRYSLPGIKVFEESPNYQVIKNHVHLLYLAKYLFDNSKDLRDQGKKPPYCCFDEMERGFFNNYKKQAYLDILGMDISLIIEKCKSLSKKEFMSFAESLYKDIPVESENKKFKVDSSIEWLQFNGIRKENITR